MAREIDRIIETELARFSVPSKSISRIAGGRHMRLVVEGPAKDGFIPYSLDCSGRGLFNFRADLRRFLRLLGFQHEIPQERVGSLGDALLEAASRSEHHTPEMTITHHRPTPAKVTPVAAQPEEPAKEEKPMADISTPNRSTLNQTEVAQITMLITQHAKVDFDKKVCDYHPSWDDERVWRMLAVGDRKHLEVGTVTKFRKSFFGSTPEELKAKAASDGRPTGNLSAMWRAIHAMEDRVSALEAAATDPKEKPANGAHPHHSN